MPPRLSGMAMTSQSSIGRRRVRIRRAVVHARTLEMLEQIGVSERLAELGIHAQFSIRDGIASSFRSRSTSCRRTIRMR